MAREKYGTLNSLGQDSKTDHTILAKTVPGLQVSQIPPFYRPLLSHAVSIAPFLLNASVMPLLFSAQYIPWGWSMHQVFSMSVSQTRNSWLTFRSPQRN